MKILRIVLETLNIEEMKAFYQNVLEMNVIRSSGSYFTVQAGKTQLTFQQGHTKPFYHFALRTDSPYFEYMYDRLLKNGADLLSDENGHTSMYWHGKQVYFKDPDGNIVETLERDNLHGEELKGWFDVCEIGLPSESVEQMSEFLSSIWDVNKTNSSTFRFYGDSFGNFVLVKNGRHWYPTDHPATIHPITVEVEGDRDEVLKHPSYPYTVKKKLRSCNEG
ncbi:VOC family protein [Bacillus timonensis]|nr:VOC family protein [Bacillus timonensis]